MKQVLQALAKTYAGPDFTASLYDDKVAQEQFFYESHPGSETPDENKKHMPLKERHVVAIYVGGLPYSTYQYEIDWFPAASSGSPEVGKYVSVEQWKP